MKIVLGVQPKISLSLDGFSALWLPVALSGPVLACSPTRVWLALMAAIAGSELVINLPAGRPVAMAAAFAGINVLEAVVFAAVLKWRSATSLDRARDVLWLTVAALLATLAAGVLASWATTADAGGQSIREWRSWTAGDLTAMVCLGTLLLRLDRPILVGWRRRVELASLVVTLGILVTAIFEARATFSADMVGVPYLVMLLLVWLGVKFGAGTITPIVALMAIVSVRLTLSGIGAFTVISAASGRQIANLQEFLILCILTSMAITLVVEERQGQLIGGELLV